MILNWYLAKILTDGKGLADRSINLRFPIRILKRYKKTFGALSELYAWSRNYRLLRGLGCRALHLQENNVDSSVSINQRYDFLFSSGRLDPVVPIMMANYLHRDNSYLAWDSFYDNLKYYEYMLGRTEVFGTFKVSYYSQRG